MKVRDLAAMSDGFDKNVAQKMPKIRRQEEGSPPDQESATPWLREEPLLEEKPPEKEPAGKEPEKRVIFSPPKPTPEKEKPLDVMSLIEDLHSQLLVSNQTKRALETDLAASQKTVHQLVQDNNDLRGQLEALSLDLKKLKSMQAEASYLREENGDALEKIKVFQQELKGAQDALAQISQERDDALSRSRELESQLEQVEVLRIRGKLRDREASHFADENRELRSRLEEIQLQNMELEREYEDMRKSFNEVKESLTFLRDTCKANYYNLSGTPE
jgi:predicted  nucleic acid-binding Zn-ribbon protein